MFGGGTAHMHLFSDQVVNRLTLGFATQADRDRAHGRPYGMTLLLFLKIKTKGSGRRGVGDAIKRGS